MEQAPMQKPKGKNKHASSQITKHINPKMTSQPYNGKSFVQTHKKVWPSQWSVILRKYYSNILLQCKKLGCPFPAKTQWKTMSINSALILAWSILCFATQVPCWQLFCYLRSVLKLCPQGIVVLHQWLGRGLGWKSTETTKKRKVLGSRPQIQVGKISYVLIPKNTTIKRVTPSATFSTKCSSNGPGPEGRLEPGSIGKSISVYNQNLGILQTYSIPIL